MDIDNVHSDLDAAAAAPSAKRQLENEDDPDFASKRLRSVTEPAEHRQPQEDVAAPSSSTQTKEDAQVQKGKGKEKEKKDRRRGTRGVQSRTDSDGQTPRTDEPKAPRLPKRQCALLIGFCGAGYNGMQMYVYIHPCARFLHSLSPSQKDVRTIEGVLFDALVKAGAVSQDNADNPVKVG